MKYERCGRSLIPSILAKLTCLVLLMALVGCATSPKMGLVTVTDDNQGFVDSSSGDSYIPFGTNYYDPNVGWPPQVWKQFDQERVKQHFSVMQACGVNCARVFLAAATFQPDPNTIDPEALKKLDKLIYIARRAGIRLILTGPDHWEGDPDYWKPDRFAGEEALRALDTFWTVLGKRYKGNATILAWDLLNEPSIPWFNETWTPKWNAWLKEKYHNREGLQAAWKDELKTEEDLGNIANPKDDAEKHNPRLHDWQLFREHLADQWVQRQVETLRAVDPTHLITIGYIQWSFPLVRAGDPHVYSAFNPHRQAQWLDFISVHFYPLMGRPFGAPQYWTNNLLYLQSILAYCHVGKPVVLEEYGWYGGGSPQGRPRLTEDDQTRWLIAEIEASRRLAQGWLSWPFADTPDATDMSLYGGMVKPNMVPKIWAWCFQAHTSNLSNIPQPTPELPDFDFNPALTATVDELTDMYEAYSLTVEAAIKDAGPIEELKLKAEPSIEEQEPVD